MADAAPDARPRLLTSVMLWVLAFLIAAAIMIYQRRTGPTYHLRGTVTADGQAVHYRLIRSHETTGAARVTLPAWKPEAGGVIRYRRYPTADAFTDVTLAKGEDGKELWGDLPAQPAAGKLEYFVVLDTGGGPVRVPADQNDSAIIRFKDPVPSEILIAHVVAMVLAILVGVRTGLAAMFTPGRYRRLAWFTFLCLTVGGGVLGPIVQKHAFGAYWTGVPFGWDLTDNKTLVMWMAWFLALFVGVILRRLRPERKLLPRVAMVAALVVMLGVYVVPHSMRGSELDYSKLDRGVNPKDAIGTSDN